MRKTLVLSLLISAVILAFYSFPPPVSSSTASPNITICLQTGCNFNTTWTATLYHSNGTSTGLTCTITPATISHCCTIDAATLSRGDYRWKIDNGSVLCTGELFGFTGSDVTYNFTCGSNCVGY